MKTVIVPIDLSDFSKKIIAFSATYAELLQARLIFVHVASLDIAYVVGDMGVQYVHDVQSNLASSNRQQLEEWTQDLADKGINFDIQLEQGIASDIIIDKVDELKADLIIMGSHGHGALYEALVGSVTHEVLKKTSIPILIVPDKQRNQK